MGFERETKGGRGPQQTVAAPGSTDRAGLPAVGCCSRAAGQGAICPGPAVLFGGPARAGRGVRCVCSAAAAPPLAGRWAPLEAHCRVTVTSARLRVVLAVPAVLGERRAEGGGGGGGPLVRQRTGVGRRAPCRRSWRTQLRRLLPSSRQRSAPPPRIPPAPPPPRPARAPGTPPSPPHGVSRPAPTDPPLSVPRHTGPPPTPERLPTHSLDVYGQVAPRLGAAAARQRDRLALGADHLPGLGDAHRVDLVHSRGGGGTGQGGPHPDLHVLQLVEGGGVDGGDGDCKRRAGSRPSVG